MTEIQGRIAHRESGTITWLGNTPFHVSPAVLAVEINNDDLARLDPTRPITITQEDE